jgi:RNA exonuclease 1
MIPRHQVRTQSIQKLVGLLIPGLTSTVVPSFLFRHFPPQCSATKNPNLPIPIPLPSDPPPRTASELPDTRRPPLGRGCATPWHCSVHRTNVLPYLFYWHASRCNTPALLLNTLVIGEEKKRRTQERISRLFPFPPSDLLVPQCTLKKSPVQYLLTVEQMVENDFPFLYISGTYFNNQKGG